MDEEKRKKLEELRKELDPEILSKMAKYLGGDEAAAAASIGTGAVKSSAGPADTLIPKSAAEKSRERRAMRFQERMAKKRRENGTYIEVPQNRNSNIQFERPVYIFSSLDIWAKIIDSQFKLLGYQESLVFSSFSSLIKEILNSHKENKEKIFYVAVAFQDIKSFIMGWQNLKNMALSEEALKFLEGIHVFYVVESMKQIGDRFISMYGSDKIIAITDEPDENRAKVVSVAGGGNSLSQGKESGREENETNTNS